MTTTLLVISVMGVPPYSARGLSQSLEPIEASVNVRRTVNGVLKDISASQFRKYRSSITCTDQQAPALNGIWVGQQVVVDCVSELSYLTSSGSPTRTVVASRIDGDYTFYRPRLTMIVTSYSVITDEYQASIGWTLELEEV